MIDADSNSDRLRSMMFIKQIFRSMWCLSSVLIIYWNNMWCVESLNSVMSWCIWLLRLWAPFVLCNPCLNVIALKVFWFAIRIFLEAGICFGGICGCSASLPSEHACMVEGFDACTAHMLWRYLWLLYVIAQRAYMHGGEIRCMHCGVVRPLVHRGSVWFFESEVRVDP